MEIEHWITRSAIGALVLAIAGLFLRVRTNETRLAVIEEQNRRAADVEKTVGETSIVLARLDERLQHMPRHDDLQLLHDRISKNGKISQVTAEKMAAVEEAVNGVRDGIRRIEDAA